jgi:transcription elongation GreA/GreB family factor
MIVKLNSTVRYTFNGTVKQRQVRFPKHEKDYNCIAPRSPMGRAMLEKKTGDKFKVETPGGRVAVEILEIRGQGETPRGD